MNRPRAKTKPNRNPDASNVEKRQRQLRDDALAEDLSFYAVENEEKQKHSAAAARPTAYEVSFDPLSRKFGLFTTGRNPEVWPDGSYEALKDVSKAVCYSSRDFACWFLCAARLAGFDARTFLALVEPVPLDADGAEDYLHELFEEKSRLLKQAEGQAGALKRIVGGEDGCIWFFKSERLSFGVSTKAPSGEVIETEDDCLNPYLFDFKLQSQPILFSLAMAAAELAGLIKPILLSEPEKNPDDVWKNAENKFRDRNLVDERKRSVLFSTEKGRARMPDEQSHWVSFGVEGSCNDESIKNIFFKAATVGPDTLAEEELSTLEEFSRVQRQFVLRVRHAHRCIELAKELFPDRFKSGSEVTVESLTTEFENHSVAPKRGRPKANTPLNPLEDIPQSRRKKVEELVAEFRSSGGKIAYRGKPARVYAGTNSDGEECFHVVTANKKSSTIASPKSIPSIIFQKTQTPS